MEGPMTAQRKTKPLLLGLIIAGLIAFSLFGIPFLDAVLFNPWALSLTGAPTLTGRWTGELVPAKGESRTLHLVLRHDVPRRCTTDCSIDGTVRLCRGTRLEREYTISGEAHTRSGQSFHVNLWPDSDYLTGELRLGRMEGEWNGEDRIRFTSPWWYHSQSATVEVRRGERPPEQPTVTFELGRGGSAEC
jgi:hypothetical protein